MPTPVSPTALKGVLVGYDGLKSQYLVNGFRSGFAIRCYGLPVQKQVVTNMKSAFDFPNVIDRKLQHELELGRILGPFTERPDISRYRISPLGVVPKKLPGEFRVIHNLSYPEGESVNDYIPQEFSTVQYATIQHAISFIKEADSIVFMAKVDIEAAFRIIPISPQDSPLLGFKWRGAYYMDAVLPMGCSSSCSIFEAFSTALEWIAMNKLGVTKVVHIIDDFLFLATSHAKCLHDMKAFMTLCEQLGVPLAPDKTVGPTTALQFLGITLDTVSMEARLPEDKLAQCRSLILSFLNREKATLREIQSLIGVLSFSCSVIPGRGFLRRLIDLTLHVTKPHFHIRITRQVKLDLLTWQEFLAGFNGKAFFIDANFLTGDYLQLFTDASGGVGYGAVCGPEWFSGTWPASWNPLNITVLELYPIVAAVATWGAAWANSSVCFYTDNEALVAIINKQTSKEPCVMALLRLLILSCLRRNINFTACHIPGRDNTLADRLSRCQIAEFLRLAPWANSEPATVPYHVSPAALGTLSRF